MSRTNPDVPTVSVIIPCFNQGRFLDAAVDSVLAQSVDDVEIIVVNDGTTDPATTDLLRDYRRPKTRVLTTPNRGVAAARNAGIAVASGRYLCALDADDLVAPRYFEKAVALLNADPALAFVSSWLETFGDESWIWKQERCDLPALLRECTVCTAALVRVAVVRSVGGYDERMPIQGYEDWDLWLRIVEAGFAGTIVPEVLFRYRRHAGTMSKTCMAGEAHVTLMRYLYDKHREHYERHLPELLRAQDAAIADILRENDALERQVQRAGKLLERRRRKHRALDDSRPDQDEGAASAVEALEARLCAEQARVRQLSADLERVLGEIAAFRNSKSWKLTAPLRAAYSLLTGAPREE